MLAIYKKEVKSYLTSMVGYVFMAFILLILGVYFTAYNLNYATPDFWNYFKFSYFYIFDHHTCSDHENFGRGEEK